MTTRRWIAEAMILTLGGLSFAAGPAAAGGVRTPDGDTGRPASSGQIPALSREPQSDWVNVKGDGVSRGGWRITPHALDSSDAKGDGVTDDTLAIQTALSKAGKGSTVYFPAGTYRITRTLELRGEPGSGGRLLGVQILGHGRDTRLVWDGPAGGKMWVDDGVIQSRYEGLLLDGRNRAAVGIYHDNGEYHFETGVRNRHLAFLNFTEAGVLTAPQQPATAEISFENCLFENCGKGVSFRKFNDFDYTFDGCEFRTCGTAVDCLHGNLYVRNCRFEGSRVVDIAARPEHGGSIRRSVSVGSHMFLDYANPVAPLTIQDCRVSGWKNPEGAIRYEGAPLMMFDCVFSSPPGKDPPVNLTRADQPVIVSENRTDNGGDVLRTGPRARITAIPAGRRGACLKSDDVRFLQSGAPAPGRVFHARRDFGAGNGKDDTAAIQKCIDAAREHGRGAVAYLPSGTYQVKETLIVTGKDYAVSGSGFCTMLNWCGAPGGTMISVHDPDNLTLEHINVGNHDVGRMNNAIDILQTGSGQASKMTYDGVWVFGKYQRQPGLKGLECRGLGDKAVVRIHEVDGNLRFVDCAAATILAGTTYEGSVTVSGRGLQRGGFLGFMTRLATVVSYGLRVQDNQGIVMSDFYQEQSDAGYAIEGGPGLPEGRVVIQNPKFHQGCDGDPNPKFGDPLVISNYAGQIFWGPGVFYPSAAKALRMSQTGDLPVTLWLSAVCCYREASGPLPEPVMGKSGIMYVLGSDTVEIPHKPPYDVTPAPWDREKSNAPPPDKLAQFSLALDDLRRLGEVDLALNHPEVGAGRGGKP